jgi:hypothetical protein
MFDSHEKNATRQKPAEWRRGPSPTSNQADVSSTPQHALALSQQSIPSEQHFWAVVQHPLFSVQHFCPFSQQPSRGFASQQALFAWQQARFVEQQSFGV